MPTSRLYQQFQRLAQQLGCDEQEISLAEVADLLCCTAQRPPAAAPHAGSGLAQLDGGGWAGTAPRLTLLDNQESLTRRRLGSAEPGPAGAGGAAGRRSPRSAPPLLLEQLGQATREGRQILRVPYYRPPPRLLPTGPLRRPKST